MSGLPADLEALAGRSGREAAESSTRGYFREIWSQLLPDLVDADTEHGRAQATLVARALALGSPDDRAQAAYDVRKALAVHGPAGAGPYIKRCAEHMAAEPGLSRRAGMLWAIGDLLDPSTMSAQVRAMQRRNWLGEALPAEPAIPRAHTRRHRKWNR